MKESRGPSESAAAPAWLGSLTPARAVVGLVVILCAALGWYAISRREPRDVSSVETLARAKQVEATDAVPPSYPGSARGRFAERNWADLDEADPSGPLEFSRPAGPVSYSAEAEQFAKVRGLAVYVQ